MKSQASYLQNVNTIFLIGLAVHVPAVCVVALHFGTGLGFAAGLGLLFLSGPALLYFSNRGSKLTSVSLGVSAMCFSALLIHASRGMTEMHFHIFTMLALMIAFRFPWPMVAATVTIAIHHLAFFIWLPNSVFNFNASWGMVAVHVFFVIFEVVPALWLTHLLDKSASSDEVGQEKLATMGANLRQVIREISGCTDVLSTTSRALSSSSSEITAGSREASTRAHTVTGAAERMSSTATAVATGMGETTGRLAEVASATDQMTSTIGEIAVNSEKARQVTDEANRRATAVTAQMNELGQSVQEIAKITGTITEISRQTNLLALNATIEAARAGPSGKGFAVVASEIKELAQQTATATEDIEARISRLKTSTTGGINEIKRVSQIIGEVSSIVSVIAAAIEEQSVVTRGIAQNITDAAASMKDANDKVTQTSQVSGEITGDIVSVSNVAAVLARNSEQLLTNASDISKVAGELKAGLQGFQEFYNCFFAEASEASAPIQPGIAVLGLKRT